MRKIAPVVALAIACGCVELGLGGALAGSAAIALLVVAVGLVVGVAVYAVCGWERTGPAFVADEGPRPAVDNGRWVYGWLLAILIGLPVALFAIGYAKLNNTHIPDCRGATFACTTDRDFFTVFALLALPFYLAGVLLIAVLTALVRRSAAVRRLPALVQASGASMAAALLASAFLAGAVFYTRIR